MSCGCRQKVRSSTMHPRLSMFQLLLKSYRFSRCKIENSHIESNVSDIGSHAADSHERNAEAKILQQTYAH